MTSGLRRGTAVVLGLLSSLAFAAWDQLNSGVTGPLYSVHFPEGTQVGYAVGACLDSLGGEIGLVIKTTDGGDTWLQQVSGTAGALNSVYFKSNDTGFAVGAAGAAIRTFDGGATWDSFTVPTSEALTGIQFPENGQTGYIFTRPRNPPSKVLKTTDGGNNWTAINVGGPASVTRGGCFANDSVGVVVGDDGLVLGTNDGLDSFWFGGAKTAADLVAATFSRDNPNIGYLVGYDSTIGVIRYTDDGGVTPWDSVECWRAAAFYGVDTRTSDIAYVCGTDSCILASAFATDFYRTTVPHGFGVALYGLHFPNGRDTGYAVGAGGAILKTCDHGWPWGPFWVAEEKGPAIAGQTVRVMSNPSRHGICFNFDTEANVLVFDALGRVVATQTAARGLNSVPLSKAGVYLLKVKADGFTTTQKFVIER